MGIAKPIATKYFFNLSNHPASKWSEAQVKEAISFVSNQRLCKPEEVQIIDLPFPQVPATDNGYDWNVKVPRQLSNLLFEYGYALSHERGLFVGTKVDVRTGEPLDSDSIEGLISADCIFHVMGESVWTFNAVSYLLKQGYGCVASTTNRKVVETQNADGTTTKTSVFEFGCFRVY